MTARLSGHQFRYDLRAFLRNRQARFFTLALPVIFLVILASVIGSSAGGVTVPGGKIDLSVYYVPGIMTLGVIAASFVNLVMSVITQRESGVLKRRRATPVPAASIIAGRALTVMVVALATSFVLLVVGWIFYGAHIPARTFPALVITIIVGAAVFCCLGYALVSAIRNEDAAQPITQAIMLPLYFISGVFYPTSGLADMARRRGQDLPGQPPRLRPVGRIQPAHDRRGLRVDRPRRPGGMGRRRRGHRDASVQLDAARHLTPPGGRSRSDRSACPGSIRTRAGRGHLIDARLRRRARGRWGERWKARAAARTPEMTGGLRWDGRPVDTPPSPRETRVA